MGKKKAPQTSDRDVRSRSTTSILSSGGLVEDGVKAKMIGTGGGGGGGWGRGSVVLYFLLGKQPAHKKLTLFQLSTRYTEQRRGGGGGQEGAERKLGCGGAK